MTKNEQQNCKTAQLIRVENVGGSVFSVIEDITPDNGQDFTLEELQGHVGGLIEIVEIPNGHILVVNEEFIINELPFNPVGTSLARATNPEAYICGDVVLCASEMVK